MGLEQVRSALAAGDLAAARAALEVSGAEDDDELIAEWLELHATLAYAHGEYEQCVTCWERLHAHHHGRDEPLAAARAAVMAAIFLLIDAGMLSTVRGWVRRAERMMGDDETPVHALVAAVRAYERLFSGDLDAAAPFAAEAVRLSETLQVSAAIAIGRTASARISVLRGDVTGGLEQLDEVAALLMSGEVDPLATGMMYCELICAAQGLGRPDLSREWTDAMSRWSVHGAVGGIHGRCRVHQAELLRLSGPSDEAERVALTACEELRPWMRREFGWPLVELGMVRLRRGDLIGAEDAFVEARRHVWPPHPGLALLRLEQGDVHTAVSEILDAIRHPVDAPSKEFPPIGELRLAPLLDALAEIAAAAGDRQQLGVAASRLRTIASDYSSPMLAAMAELAAARLALASGDAERAVAHASNAATAFLGLDAPFDAARAVEVAAAGRGALGQHAQQHTELRRALALYQQYGAHLRVAAIQGRLTGASTASPVMSAVVSDAMSGTFRRTEAGWEVGLNGDTVTVADLKGLRYLHRMLTDPGREFHVLDLVAVEGGTVPGTAGSFAATGLPALDDLARDAYRRRLADIDDDIAEATRNNDIGRLEKAEQDRQYLVDELSRAVGLGGRMRRSGGTSERARTAVARNLRYALDEIARRHTATAVHLRASLHTGTYCTYRPDALVTIKWTL